MPVAARTRRDPRPVIVVDASTLVTALVDEGAPGALARERTAGADLHVPHLTDVEVLSALRWRVLAGRLQRDRAASVMRDYTALALERWSHGALLPRAWELRDALTAYDAQYVALAELLDAPLVTCDGPLARAPGPRCRIELLR